MAATTPFCRRPSTESKGFVHNHKPNPRFRENAGIVPDRKRKLEGRGTGLLHHPHAIEPLPRTSSRILRRNLPGGCKLRGPKWIPTG